MHYRIGTTHTGRPVYLHPQHGQLAAQRDHDLFDAYLIYAYLRHGYSANMSFEAAARACVQELQSRRVFRIMLDEAKIQTVQDLLACAQPLVAPALQWSLLPGLGKAEGGKYNPLIAAG